MTFNTSFHKKTLQSKLIRVIKHLWEDKTEHQKVVIIGMAVFIMRNQSERECSYKLIRELRLYLVNERLPV